jgi:hypothetical protein
LLKMQFSNQKPMKYEDSKPPARRNEGFLYAELDIIHSSYKMLLYREGYDYPNTYYSKKKHFAEVQDKEYLMLSMIERFVGKNNCFFRKQEQLNGKMYSPATMIEFWRIFEDDTQEKLVLRMYHPTKNIIPFELFDYLKHNEKVKAKLYKYYELLRLGKMDAIGYSKPRSLEQDEQTDFFWHKISAEAFAQHLAHLYSKYPMRGRIDIYKETYLKNHYPNQVAPPKSISVQTPNTIPKPTEQLQANKELLQVWAKCLEFIRTEVDETTFLTWFAPIQPIQLENKKLTLQLPSPFYYQFIEENYVLLLRKMLNQVVGKEATLGYSIQNHNQ